MKTWTIESSAGVQMGIYAGETEEDAVRAMGADIIDMDRVCTHYERYDPARHDLIVREIEVTDEQIEALRTEAGAAGDIPMVAICDVALDEVCDEYPGAAQWQAEPLRRALAMDREAARLECARVIAAAKAMDDAE